MTDSKQQEACNYERQVIAAAATIPSDARHSGSPKASANRRELCRAQRFDGAALLLILLIAGLAHAFTARADDTKPPAQTPPMGWNDWAHYQCGFTALTILSNARALVKSGLAAHGYDTVTIDDCWMLKERDAAGNLQVDSERFPQGIKAVAETVHGLGLKFGIYEDAGYLTCGGFAGSGEPKGGGKDHFLQDAKLFASWGVDYLKLDGCNVYVPPGGSEEFAYRKAYAAEAAALKEAGKPVAFSESAPAYFQNSPEWYDVLAWVRGYGQLWREGTDVYTFDPKKPDVSRFESVLWNYAYNQPLGRFQKPDNWNDADFIIGGDRGMTLAETRTQLALWSMMSAPLILSSDVEKLDPKAIAILSNDAVLAIDQDALGQTANLVRRTASTDVLFKRLSGGDYAIAVSNRDVNTVHVEMTSADFGFNAGSRCRFDLQNLWTEKRQSAVSTLQTEVDPHDTQIWRVHASSSCAAPSRTGTITLTANEKSHDFGFVGYTRCLSADGNAGACTATSGDRWTITPSGTLKSDGRCLTAIDGKPEMRSCSERAEQHWKYTLAGNLVSSNHQCLTGSASGLSLESCGHNQPDQIWSLPN